MGELLDSESLATISVSAYQNRVSNYLSAFGNQVDIWEVGNEVNGNWTGPYDQVSAKIYAAYGLVKAAGKRTELTFWYDDGCGNGPSELDPIAFTNQYVPTDMRLGLNYVTVSYYETQCSNIRPSVATLTTFFNQLHILYPNARLGFGEVGFPNAVSTNTAAAQSMINYYYNLNISVPGYIGGYFWWYYYEDMLPYTTKPLWQTLNTAFATMPVAISPTTAGNTPTTIPTIPPTSVPTQNPTAIFVTNTPTLTPTPSVVSTKLTLIMKLHGIGKGGDSINDKSTGNITPSHPQKSVIISLYDVNNVPLPVKTGTVTYDNSTGTFSGTIDLGNTFATGYYSGKVSIPSYLAVSIPGILSLTSGKTTSSTLTLVSGDMNNDGKMDIIDYNMLMDCYSDFSPAKNCDSVKKLATDLTDDGNVNYNDLNLFLREMSVRQ